MASVLSQEEVDSLLDGIGEGEVETETDIPESEDGFQSYDFGKQGDPIHLKMPTLGIINERLITLLNTSLSSSIGSMVDVSLSEVDSVKYGEFCRSLPLPSSLNIFKMDPLRGFALLVFEGTLVFSFVDRYFGGKGVSHVKLEGKSFTPIEVKIIERVVSIVLGDLQHAWQEVYPVKMIPTRTEMDPQFAGISTPEDMIIASRFIIDIGNFQGNMAICLPYSLLEPIRNKLKNTFQGEKLEADQRWRKCIEEKVMDLHVDLSFTLGTTDITGRELLNMKVGDVFQLDQSPKDPVIINAEGLPKFRGYMGAYKNKKAVRVKDRIYAE